MAGLHRIERRKAPELPFGEQLHPLLARCYANRNIVDPSELELGLEHLAPFGLLGGIEAATNLLLRALTEQWRILVIGDFDADGATSTALAVKALRMFGHSEVDFLVPNRFEYGYGLSPEIVEVAVGYRPDLIITVDNGISSIGGVEAARAAGIRVLVTDHHLPGNELPAADAIVNPNLPGDPFPSRSLAGVGVIFYVMAALRAGLRERGRLEGREPNLGQLLDLVALGTVADVVPLDRNNRILVSAGLARIRAGRASPGIVALARVSGRSIEKMVASDFGFALGPRLNAAGRLDDMTIGIRCLLAETADEAWQVAVELDRLNVERRAVENEMREQADADLESLFGTTEGELPWAITLYRPDWHEGVVGILASRVKERYHRPVIVFTDAGSGEVKGSARSIPGLHIRDTLDAVAAKHSGMLSRFGGHAMAAGLTLPKDRLDPFAEAFKEEVRRLLDPAHLEGVLASDGDLEPAWFTLDTARLLRNSGPWGQGFPEPLFDGEFELLSANVVGERHLKMKLRPAAGPAVDAIAFNTEPLPSGTQWVRAAYRLDVNEYRGVESLQMVIQQITPLDYAEESPNWSIDPI